MQIKVSGLHKSYGDLQVISDFNMSFSSGKIHCIFGPSGCGKTTLMNILAGVINADKGCIEGLEGKSFAYVFQEDRLLPWATIGENILFVLENRYSRAEAQERLDKYISLVELSQFKSHYPDELSGGMKQRASIARALAYGGDVLIMDEPFKGLHFELKKALMDFIISCRYQRKNFFFFITHDVEEALSLADEIYIFQGPPLTLKRRIAIDISPCDGVNGQKEKEKYKELLLQNIS